MNVSELVPQQSDAASAAARSLFNRHAAAMRLGNVFWFIQLRWFACVGVAGTGILARLRPAFFRQVSLQPPTVWIWPLLLCLCGANAWFYFASRKWAAKPPAASSVLANLWIQIVFDLLLLSLLLGLVNGFQTFVVWLYVLHVVLAAVFFSRRQSLLVALTPGIVYTTGSVVAGADLTTCRTAVPMLGTVAVWFIVWYMVSALSQTVWTRVLELDRANEQLQKADEEKSRYVLRTVHDLKSPLAGIDNSISLIRLQFWDDLPEKVGGILERIELRARALNELVRDTDLLHRLRTMEPRCIPAQVDLGECLGEVAAALAGELARQHVKLVIDVDGQNVETDPRQLTILLTQLLTNAIRYSPAEQSVEVTADDREDRVILYIRDHGIGIRQDALDQVGEEYYRTKEAKRFNPLGTGLGLSLVRQIALNLHLGVRLESEPDRGTTAVVSIPRSFQDQ